MDLNAFERRKRDHLEMALRDEHQAVGRSGIDDIVLLHDAIPELDFETVRLSSGSSTLFATRTPFFVSGMTAGHAEAPTLNRVLAQGCQARGWILGLGSQRRELETSDFHESKSMRREFPDLCILGNIGLSQLIEFGPQRVSEFSQAWGASAVCVHANALQEALQVEGTPRFAGGLKCLEQLVQLTSVPIVLKETGCGFSSQTLKRLRGIGLAAVDVSGLGGTHWGRIEGERAFDKDRTRALAAKTFENWGISTVDSVLAASKTVEGEVWASGGVRSGLDAAKLIALGAHRVGYARPALDAALRGHEALTEWMGLQEVELKTALFCTGSADPAALRTREGLWKRI